MDINKILRSDYLDILFEGRNKNYGGYELRKKYPKRARNAAVLLFGAAMLFSAYPIIAGIFGKDMVKTPPISTRVHDLQKLPIDRPIPEPKPLPTVTPPPSRPTIKIVDPKIEIDEHVKEAEKLAPALNNNLSVGPVTSDGDSSGIDRTEIVDRAGRTELEITAVPNEIATAVDQPPAFNGDLREYLEKHLRYPDDARENGREGRSILRFVVNEDGSISGTEVLRTAGYTSLDAEAMRVVSGMPHWNPGKLQGKRVKVYFTLPITFELD